MFTEQPSETKIQCEFISHTRKRAKLDPIWAWWFSVPNGGHRSGKSGAIHKNMGMRKGVPDTCWPIMRGPYAGLWIEFKDHQGKTSDEQDAWIAHLRSQHFQVEVCRSVDEAIEVAEAYAAL